MLQGAKLSYAVYLHHKDVSMNMPCKIHTCKFKNDILLPTDI